MTGLCGGCGAAGSVAARLGAGAAPVALLGSGVLAPRSGTFLLTGGALRRKTSGGSLSSGQPDHSSGLDRSERSAAELSSEERPGPGGGAHSSSNGKQGTSSGDAASTHSAQQLQVCVKTLCPSAGKASAARKPSRVSRRKRKELDGAVSWTERRAKATHHPGGGLFFRTRLRTRLHPLLR